MADRVSYEQRLVRESQGFLANAEALLPNAQYWMAELLNGHPRAQDFEPTGHGGSDPTSVNGIRPDSAHADGKRVKRLAERIWRDADEMSGIIRRYQPALRPSRKSEDLEDMWCVVHLELGYNEPRAHLDLCKPCYTFKSNNNGEYPTVEDVHYYMTHYGRWPKRLTDPTQPSKQPSRQAAPKRRYVATQDALQAGAASLTPTEHPAQKD